MGKQKRARQARTEDAPGGSPTAGRRPPRTGRQWKLSRTLVVLLLAAAVAALWYAGKQKNTQRQPTLALAQTGAVPPGSVRGARSADTPAVPPRVGISPPEAVPSSGPLPVIEVKGEPGKRQSVDVISGKPIDPGVYADYGGYRIYFCCPVSISNFQRNAQGYLRAIELRGIVLDRAPSP